MCMARKEYGSDQVILNIIRLEEMKQNKMEEQKNGKNKWSNIGNYDRFINMTSGKYVNDYKGN